MNAVAIVFISILWITPSDPITDARTVSSVVDCHKLVNSFYEAVAKSNSANGEEGTPVPLFLLSGKATCEVWASNDDGNKVF